MKNIIIILLALWLIASVTGASQRNLLQKIKDLLGVKECLITDLSWIKYPKYSDRQGWDKLILGLKDKLITTGEAYLDYEWKVVTATDYLEFEKSGSRNVMETPLNENNNALSNLVLAELAEGKGRFIKQIANGIWLSCEMTSWALSAHIDGAQKEKTSLPSYKENIIDLKAGDMGSFLAWTYYFFKDELDKIQPLISERLRKNIEDRILAPYMNRNDFWWQAYNVKPGFMVNNWNPWCNCNVLECFLLMEDNPERLSKAVYKTMVSVDQFINYNKEDGACEEGPSYWGHAAGKLYDYLQLLYDATGGNISIFNQNIIKNMGEYIDRSYVGNDWVVNFADASAKGDLNSGIVFRYGKAIGSNEMKQFAAYLFNHKNYESYSQNGLDLFRTLENLSSQIELSKTKASIPKWNTAWYPETEYCYMRSASGLFFSAIGGNNNQSHNHNDVGSFMLYVDQTPMIIDAGVGTYTRQTFSSERYKIWTMQSNYHNVPLINGVPQSAGAEFRSSNVSFDSSKMIFSLDISKAYPENAQVEKWQRTYNLDEEKGLSIMDEFKLNQTIIPNQINFLTWGKPDISITGDVTIEKNGVKIRLEYDKTQFKPCIEKIGLEDKKLSDVWGKQIFRLSLNANELKLSGNYVFYMKRD